MPKVPVAAPAAAPAPAMAPADANKVILTIGDEKITVSQFEQIVNSLPPQYQAIARGPQKRQFIENIIQMKIMANKAEQAKLDKTKDIEEKLKFQRDNTLAQAYFEDMQKNLKLDDSMLQMYYDAHKDQYESVKAKHILIRVKGAPMPGATGKPELSDEEALAKAQDIRKRLVAGGDFAGIAKAESDDTGSGAQGGELGEFHRGMMVPPFEQAAFSLKIGEVSEPVKSPFGYHIIVVEEHKSKPLAEAKADIEKTLRPEMARKEAEKLRAQTNVLIDDGFFGPAQAPAAPPAAR